MLLDLSLPGTDQVGSIEQVRTTAPDAPIVVLAERPDEGAVVELGHAMGLSVVAEGVETDTELAQVRLLGCDAAQGYLLGRPVPDDEVEALLTP